MKFKDIKSYINEDGRIVKGVNTTADVGVNQISIEAGKLGFKVDRDGKPPTLSKKVKGKSTNVLFNLGLSESNKKRNLIDFINFCKEQLELKSSPPVKFVSDTEDQTFGYFDNDHKNIVVQLKGRHQMDVMRTIAHEFVHYKQDKSYNRKLDGSDGSSDENEANALAGVILRRWGQKNPTLFTETIDKNTESSVYFINMQEQLGQIAPKSEIYVDMDGVLADFFGEWTRLMNVDHWTNIDTEHELPAALQKIRDTDEFWLRLPILPQAKELLTLIKNIKGEYNICSSPLADDPNSEPHKREWIKKNLGFFPPKNVYITHNKAQFAKNADGTPNILIDDFGRNVRQWEDAGGIGFKYKDHKFERTAKQLQKHIAEEKMSKSDIKSAHKTADKIKDKPKAKKSIAKWAKEKGMDPEGAIYAIATNMQKKKASESSELSPKMQDAVAKAADEKYWKDNPNGKWEKIGNVTSMVMPPEQHHPDAIKAQGLKIDAAQAARTKAYKDKVKASGGKFMGQTGPEPVQATPTADDPKPWILTKGMPRPWRKDQKPRPMGQVAVDYNKQYPNAAKARAAQIAAKKMASESYTRAELPQIRKKHLKSFPHVLESVKVKKLIPVQNERIEKNYTKQLKKISKGRYHPIIIDSNYKIINGHHRYDIIKMLEMDKITVAKLPFTLEQIMLKFKTKKLREGISLKFERGTGDYDTLHIKATGKPRVELRGKPGYESDGYDPDDRLHKILDKVGKSANISDLMNGDTVHINPKHPSGPKAIELLSKEHLPRIISPALELLDSVFSENGYEIRIVGGAVRDIALDKTPKDIDLATDATPEEMQKMFDKKGIKHKPTGLQHGTITAIIDKEPFEITTLRADVETDGRHAEVEFVRSWEEDAKRRDLTYNAMSMDFDGKIYDYFNGMDDLQNKVSNFVGEPAERIKEDYLRILRYFRFQGRLDKPKWEEKVIKTIKENVSGLKKISVERIWLEMEKILSGKNVSDILTHMDKTGVAKIIDLPVQNAKAVKDNEDAIITLARLVDDDSIAKKWKFSKEDHTTLLTLVNNKNKPLTQKSAEDLIVDGKDKNILAKLAELQGKHELANYIQTFQAPDFPITGNDLISMGHKSGPEMGQKLNALKQQWKQSNFTASKDTLLKSINEDINPNFNREWEEAQRYSEFRKIGKEEWIKLANKGKPFNVTRKSVKKINNTDAADINAFNKLKLVKQLRVISQLKKGIYELPIVALYSDGYLELIGGNTRLTAMMAKEGKAMVWVFPVPDEIAELADKYEERKNK